MLIHFSSYIINLNKMSSTFRKHFKMLVDFQTKEQRRDFLNPSPTAALSNSPTKSWEVLLETEQPQ